MSTPPITQKNALVAAFSASSWSCAASDKLAQLPHVAVGLSSSMIAKPPPPNGSTRSCAGKASTPAMMRRAFLNDTLPGFTAPPGSTMVARRSERKNDGSKERLSKFVLNTNRPPSAPQYHLCCQSLARFSYVGPPRGRGASGGLPPAARIESRFALGISGTDGADGAPPPPRKKESPADPVTWPTHSPAK